MCFWRPVGVRAGEVGAPLEFTTHIVRIMASPSDGPLVGGLETKFLLGADLQTHSC